MKHKDLEVFFHELNERVVRLSQRVGPLEQRVECLQRGTHTWEHSLTTSDMGTCVQGYGFQCVCCGLRRHFPPGQPLPEAFQRLIDAKYVFDVFPK